MIFLDTSETLARIRAALPRGHRILELLGGASPVALQPIFPGGIGAAGSACPGEIGVLLWQQGAADPRSVAALAWLGDRAGASQFILDLPPARYRTEYWSAGEGRLTGVEIGTGPRLVLSPPAEAFLVALVESLP